LRQRRSGQTQAHQQQENNKHCTVGSHGRPPQFEIKILYLQSNPGDEQFNIGEAGLDYTTDLLRLVIE
jgi:predicted metal-dependent TIM-barrel fold hydrolase